MRPPEYIQTIQSDSEQVPRVNEHEKSVAFFERHRAYFEQFAGHGIEVKAAPPQLNTFAFDLNNNTIYLTDKFYKLLGYADEGTSFATHHEIEHFREKLALLQEEGGAEVFAAYLRKLDEKVSPHAEAFSVMDNCISDVRQNSSVVERTHAGFDAVEKKLYTDVQFPEVDFTEGKSKQPLHIQLPYAILNEYRSGRKCIVDERVRKIIDDLQHTPHPDGGTRDIFAMMTNPDPKIVPMSIRLRLQDAYVWPRVLELLEEDMKEEEKRQKAKKDSESTDSKSEENESPEGKKSDAKSQDGTGNTKKPKPSEVFKDAYAEAKKRVPNAMPVEAQKEALKKWVEENGSPEKMENKALAERLGVKQEDVKKYKDIARTLNQINPETQESVIDDLEKVIRRIISSRLKEKQVPRYPVEDGDELLDAGQWLADTNAGNFQPKVWGDTEIKLKKAKKFGEVEFTLICDRSGSMEGQKLREQQKSLVLFMEALKRFNDVLDDEEVSMEKPLVIKSEVYTFQADKNDGIPVKKMGKGLSEKERIESCAKVGSAPGNSTSDYVPLESIQRGLTDETRSHIEAGELKKIVIVFTDGDSSDASRVETVCKSLQAQGVMVIGVGITEEGRSALVTYAPNAQLAEKAEDLPRILGDILKGTLRDV